LIVAPRTSSGYGGKAGFGGGGGVVVVLRLAVAVL
jgi:hypothetical protein